MKRLSYLITAGILLVICGCVYLSPTVAGLSAAKGSEAGLPSLPYYTFSKEGLIKLNDEMVEYKVPFTLADTFQAVYGMDLKDFNPSGYKEDLFTNMMEATHFFQKILKSKNIQNADHYFLTSVDTAREDGLMLFAAVYRPGLKITVADKYDPSVTRTLTPGDLEFFRPYQTNVDGANVDKIYEWAALPVDSYKRQSHQAVLLTLTANMVIRKKAEPEYWEKEKKWIAGDYKAVAIEQDRAYCEFLGIQKGYTCDFE